LLTAKSDIETKIEGFELGIDDYIEKPFNAKLLLIRVNSILYCIANYSGSSFISVHKWLNVRNKY
jgi:DNA-binding response OmpR family regulator